MLCVHLCLFTWNLAENVNLQTLHEKGFSPVCACNLLFKWKVIKRANQRTSEEIASTPVCIFLGLFKEECEEIEV